jgi:hypothetical protein
MSDTTSDHDEFHKGDLRLWVTPDRGSLMIKSVTKHGDPVELGESEVEMLIESLKAMLLLMK